MSDEKLRKAVRRKMKEAPWAGASTGEMSDLILDHVNGDLRCFNGPNGRWSMTAVAHHFLAIKVDPVGVSPFDQRTDTKGGCTYRDVATEHMKGSANDRQVAGSHYQGEYQHWDFAAEMTLNYFEGQITKYICRHRAKNGDEDLDKARHFLDKYIEVLEAGCYHGSEGTPPSNRVTLGVTKLGQRYELTYAEARVIELVTCWDGVDSLRQARALLDQT